jgi:hypothetical protein
MSKRARKSNSSGKPGPGRQETPAAVAAERRFAANEILGITPRSRYLVTAVCALLVLAVFLVFGQTLGYDFVNYDDQDYVYDNPNVSRGLTFSGIAWAFTHFHSFNWHPLTWLTHMLDCH